MKLSSLIRFRPTERRNIWRRSRGTLRSYGTFQARIRVALLRAMPELPLRSLRWCSLPTPISSLLPICSRAILRATIRPGGPRAVVGLEIQVDSYDDYQRKRARRSVRDELHPRRRKTLDWLYFLTGNASAPRAQLDRVGRFDEDFTGYGHEDLELGYRLKHAGVAIEYEPLAVNYHWHPVPFDQQQGRMELAGKSTVRFYRKHPTLGVQAKLGMTPVSLVLCTTLSSARPRCKHGSKRTPRNLDLPGRSHFNITILRGVKAALRDSG